MRMLSWGHALFLSLGAVSFLLGTSHELGAQQLGNNCDPRSFRVINSRGVAPGQRVSWIGLPDIVCPDGVRIRADSAVVWEAAGRTEFLGAFRYQDPERQLQAGYAEYFQREGRLFARGQVRATTLGGGTEVRGDLLNLYEAPGEGADDRIIVNGQPAFALIQASDSARAAGAAPYEVTGLTLRIEGERFLYADGEVEVVRDSLQATARSLSFDRTTGNLRLTGGARVESGTTVSEGDAINLLLPNDVLTSMRVLGNAKLTTEELDLTGAEIEIDFRDSEMERLMAWRGEPPTPPAPDSIAPAGEASEPPERGLRPEAIAEDFYLTADSIEVEAPGGILESVFAYGRARAESGGSAPEASAEPVVAAEEDEPEQVDGVETTPDSQGIDPKILGRDWIEGDTIVARFVLVQPQPDSLAEAGADSVAEMQVDTPEGDDVQAREYVLRQLVAVGGARTLHRSAPERSPAADSAAVIPPDRSRWSISYLLADQIVLTLSEGQVRHVLAEGTVSGIQLEPEQQPQPAAVEETSDPVVDR